MGVAGAQHRGRLLERQIGHDQTAGAGLGETLHERLDPWGENHVGVTHEHHRDAGRQGASYLQDAGQGGPGRQGTSTRLMDHRTVGQRI